MKNLFNRNQDEGMALLTVLSVMLILLIFSLAIVTSMTDNLKIVGNMRVRLQTLNLANSASMYAIYEIQTVYDTTIVPWKPGATPTPVAGLSFTTYAPLPTDKLNGLPGQCKVAYVNNLGNPNKVTGITVPGAFSSVAGPVIEVGGDGAVILAQGAYEGYKRTVKVTLKHQYYGSVADSEINFSDGMVILNGIQNLDSLAPGTGSIYSGGDINYSDITSYKCLQGSRFFSHGDVNHTGGALIIDGRYIESGVPVVQIVDDWSLNDRELTDGDPGDTSDYTPLVPGTTEDLPAGTTIYRPSFPAPAAAIPDTKRYTRSSALYVNNDTFINGSFHHNNPSAEFAIGNGNLFVNGTLKVDGFMSFTGKGKLFVAGYYNDKACTDPNFAYGLSLELNDVHAVGIDPDASGAIFTDGDIRLKTPNSINLYYGTPASVIEWFKEAPQEMEKVRDTFLMLNLSSAGGWPYGAWQWYSGGGGAPASIVAVPGYTGKQVLLGQANTELVDMGLSPIPEEVSDWFASTYADDGFKSPMSYVATWWTFSRNPAFYESCGDRFLQAVIYTYGTVSTEDSPYPMRIVGGIVAKHRDGVSPQNNSFDITTSHGGKINLEGGTSVILYPDGFKSGKPIIKPLLSVYSWEELY